MPSFEVLDWLVVAAYFAVLFGLAVWLIRKKTESATDYFLAGRNVGWFVIGASIFASNIGSEHIVGLAGTAHKHGLVMGLLPYGELCSCKLPRRAEVPRGI